MAFSIKVILNGTQWVINRVGYIGKRAQELRGMGDEERWTLKETQFFEILEPFRRLSWSKSGMARILS
jgi:hypothetical protein